MLCDSKFHFRLSFSVAIFFGVVVVVSAQYIEYSILAVEPIINHENIKINCEWRKMNVENNIGRKWYIAEASTSTCSNTSFTFQLVHRTSLCIFLIIHWFVWIFIVAVRMCHYFASTEFSNLIESVFPVQIQSAEEAFFRLKCSI